MVSNPMQQSGANLRVAEDRQPLADFKVGHDDQAGMLIDLTGERGN